MRVHEICRGLGELATTCRRRQPILYGVNRHHCRGDRCFGRSGVVAKMNDRKRVLVLSNTLMALVGVTAVAVTIVLLSRAIESPLISPGSGGSLNLPPETRDRFGVAVNLAIATSLVLIIGGCAMLLRIIGPLWRRLATSEAWTKAVVTNVADGILVIDSQQLIRSYNPACQGMFGYAPADVVGGPLKLLMPGDPDQPVEAMLSRLFSSKKNAANKNHAWCETIGRRRDGEAFPLEMSISPLAKNSPSLVALVLRDVTRRRQADERLQHHMNLLGETNTRLEAKTNELEQINHELEEFTYLASHDLKEPLRGIGAYCDILLEDYHAELDDQGRERLETLVRLCRRLEQLIDDLLRYTRVGFCRSDRETVELGDVLGDVLATLKPVMERRRAKIGVGSLPRLSCDPTLVGEVFRNLIVNAMKFNRRPPEVRIGYLDRPQPVLFVRDNGIGISTEHHEAIFEMFRRLHGRQHYEGTGAGLSIVRKIIQGHGGRIWLESQPGAGTTFYFTLGNSNREQSPTADATDNATRPPAGRSPVPAPKASCTAAIGMPLTVPLHQTQGLTASSEPLT